MTETLGEAWLKIAPIVDGFAEDLTKQAEDAIGSAGQGIDAKDLTEKLTPAAATIAAATTAISESYNSAKASIVEATGASGEALEEMLDITREVAASGVSTSLGEIGEVVGALQQRLEGLSRTQLTDLTGQITKLAEITGGDASESVAAITDTFEKWNVAAEDQSDTLDRLFSAAQRAGVPFDELTALLVKNAGPLQRFGFSLEETVGVITQIEQAGGDAQPVLSALNLAFARLAQDSADPVRALEQLGKAIRDAPTDAAAYRIGIEALGARTANTLVPALRSGALEAGRLSQALDEGAGSIDDVHESTRSLGDRLAELRNKIGATIAPFASQAAVIATIVAGIGPLVQGFSALIAPLRAQQAAAALSGESLSLAEAAANKYGDAAKKAAVGALALTAAIAIQQGLGEVADMFFEASRGADTFENRLQGAAGAMAQFATGDLWGGIKDAIAMDKEVDQTAASLEDLARQFQQGAISSAQLREGFTRLGAAGEVAGVLNTVGEAAAANRAKVRGLGVGVDEAASMVSDAVAEFEAANGALSANRQATIDNMVAQGNYRGALALVDQWQQKVAASGNDATLSHKEQAAAARDLRQAELALVGGLVGVTSGAISLKQAQSDLTAVEGRLQRMRANGKRGTQAYASALREERDASLNVLQSQNSLTGSVLDFVDAEAEAGSSTREVVKAVKAQGEAAGLTERQVGDLVKIARHAIDTNEDFGRSAVRAGNDAKRSYGSVPGAIRSVVGGVRSVGRGAASGFAAESRSGASQAAAAFGGVPGAMSHIAGAIAGIGASAAAGFINALSVIVGQAASIAAQAVAAARSAVGANSPSTEFAAIGRDSVAGFMGEFDRLPDNVSRAMDRTLAGLRSGGAATPALQSQQQIALGGGTSFLGARSGDDLDDALERVAAKMGGLAPTIIQGGVLDLMEATGQADIARRKRAVLLGGRRKRAS